MNALKAIQLLDRLSPMPLRTDLDVEAGVIFGVDGDPLIVVDSFQDRELTDEEVHIIASVVAVAVNEWTERNRLIIAENYEERATVMLDHADANNPHAIYESNCIPAPDSPLRAGNPGGAMGIECRQDDDQRRPFTPQSKPIVPRTTPLPPEWQAQVDVGRAHLARMRGELLTPEQVSLLAAYDAEQAVQAASKAISAETAECLPDVPDDVLLHRRGAVVARQNPETLLGQMGTHPCER